MNIDLLAPVVAYCAQEVMRQGHDGGQVDGIERTAWMLDAWSYALERTSSPRVVPTVDDVIEIGKRVERRTNAKGVRECNVSVGGRLCPRWEKVPALLVDWGEWVRLDVNVEAFDAYRRLLDVHPFEDGNGRTGKVILNWLNGTLLNPVFPPADFWGRPIRNP